MDIYLWHIGDPTVFQAKDGELFEEVDGVAGEDSKTLLLDVNFGDEIFDSSEGISVHRFNTIILDKQAINLKVIY